MTEVNKFQRFLKTIGEGGHLTENEAQEAFQIIMKGAASPAQIAAFLMGLKRNGETIDEITAGATVLRNRAEPIKAPENCIDTCGTGGDGLHTLNISTAVAFVLAACGIPVAKHGNRSVSSKSGSADVLEVLNINLKAPIKQVEESLNTHGIAFLMAPIFHTAMRHVAPIRKELGFRSIFNLLGPLSNPAKAPYYVMGVYDSALFEPFAECLNNLGAKRAWVVHGRDGMDEISVTAHTDVVTLDNGKVDHFTIKPETLGLEPHTLEELEGGQAEYNAERLMGLLGGKRDAYFDAVCLNSAAGLVVAHKAKDLKEGLKLAAEAIDSGKALQKLQDLQLATQVIEDA